MNESGIAMARMPGPNQGKGNVDPGRGRGMSTRPQVHSNVRLGTKGSHFSAGLVEPDATILTKIRYFL